METEDTGFLIKKINFQDEKTIYQFLCEKNGLISFLIYGKKNILPGVEYWISFQFKVNKNLHTVKKIESRNIFYHTNNLNKVQAILLINELVNMIAKNEEHSLLFDVYKMIFENNRLSDLEIIEFFIKNYIKYSGWWNEEIIQEDIFGNFENDRERNKLIEWFNQNTYNGNIEMIKKIIESLGKYYEIRNPDYFSNVFSTLDFLAKMEE